MAIAPFWFSTEHLWSAITPFWLSTDDIVYLNTLLMYKLVHSIPFGRYAFEQLRSKPAHSQFMKDKCLICWQFISWEPEGCWQCLMLFCWEPERRYHCTKSMAVVPFWFSLEHCWTALMPFWFSTEHCWTALTPFWSSVEYCWIDWMAAWFTRADKLFVPNLLVIDVILWMWVNCPYRPALTFWILIQ